MAPLFDILSVLAGCIATVNGQDWNPSLFASSPPVYPSRMLLSEFLPFFPSFFPPYLTLAMVFDFRNLQCFQGYIWCLVLGTMLLLES